MGYSIEFKSSEVERGKATKGRSNMRFALTAPTTVISLIKWPRSIRAERGALGEKKVFPSDWNRTSNFGIPQVFCYSPTLFQLSYRRLNASTVARLVAQLMT